MDVPTGQFDPYRISQGVRQNMDFGAQPTFAAADSLVFVRFFLAPALC
jgi:hypothetical protein